MKKLLLSLVGLLGCLSMSAREVISLNQNWKFVLNHEINSAPKMTVNLPHTWNLDALSGKKDYYRGIGNYTKDIFIPARWSGSRIFIKFYGAFSQANLLVNGKYIGEHQGGYTAFCFELTHYLRFGSNNNLWVMVSNTPQFDFMPLASDNNLYGGLYRDVELIVVPQSHISLTDYASDGIYITPRNVSPEVADVTAQVKLSGSASEELSVRLHVFDRIGNLVQTVNAVSTRLNAGGMGLVDIPFQMLSPKLWNGGRDAYLYKFKVEVLRGQEVVDTLSVQSGLRTVGINAQGEFLLNGNSYPIHGITRTEDYAMVGSALRIMQQKEDIGLITELGANAVRMKNAPHDRRFFSLCDRNGILVWSDLPFNGPTYTALMSYIDKPFFRENGIQQLREMIRQNYNHPSVAFWGIFSNLDRRGNDPLNYIRELNRCAHDEDMTRLTAASSSQDGEINFVTDVIGWNQYFGWKKGSLDDLKVWLLQLRRDWSRLRSGISEYGAEGNIYQQGDTLQKPFDIEVFHSERWQTHVHEEYLKVLSSTRYIWGGFACSLCDFGAAYRENGDTPGINECGLVTFDRKTRKDAFYLYKSRWNTTDPFIHISEQRWIRPSARLSRITVYSNRSWLNLTVNGVDYEIKQGVNGKFVWDIPLREGRNKIKASDDTISVEGTVFMSTEEII